MIIKIMMERGIISNPYEITEQNFKEHWMIDVDFGFVRKEDIGKRLFLQGGIIQMENDFQLEQRQNKRIQKFNSTLRFQNE